MQRPAALGCSMNTGRVGWRCLSRPDKQATRFELYWAEMDKAASPSAPAEPGAAQGAAPTCVGALNAVHKTAGCGHHNLAALAAAGGSQRNGAAMSRLIRAAGGSGRQAVLPGIACCLSHRLPIALGRAGWQSRPASTQTTRRLGTPARCSAQPQSQTD